MQNKQPGISFIEILVLLLLIAIAGSIVIPRFITNRPGTQQKKFFSEFAVLVTDAAYHAVMSQKTHQFFFDFDTKRIIVKQYDPTSTETNNHKKFIPVPADTFQTTLAIPDQFLIKNFIVQGTDHLQSGLTMHDAWFYIMPDGSSQAVILNIQDDTQDATARFSITINPFYSQAELHDTFQKP